MDLLNPYSEESDENLDNRFFGTTLGWLGAGQQDERAQFARAARAIQAQEAARMASRQAAANVDHAERSLMTTRAGSPTFSDPGFVDAIAPEFDEELVKRQQLMSADQRREIARAKLRQANRRVRVVQSGAGQEEDEAVERARARVEMAQDILDSERRLAEPIYRRRDTAYEKRLMQISPERSTGDFPNEPDYDPMTEPPEAATYRRAQEATNERVQWAQQEVETAEAELAAAEQAKAAADQDGGAWTDDSDDGPVEEPDEPVAPVQPVQAPPPALPQLPPVQHRFGQRLNQHW